MRNPIYALAILLTIALAALMTGCDIRDPSPTWTYDWFLYDTDGNLICYLFPDTHGSYVRVTADSQYVFFFKDGVFNRYEIETAEEVAFDWPFAGFDGYYPSYDVIYLQARIGDTWDFYTMNIQTGEVTSLTDAQAEETMSYSIAYDRKELYYVTNTDSTSTIRRVDFASGVDDPLCTTTDGQYKYPAITPNGEAVYYYLNADADSLKGLYRINLASQDVILSTNTPFFFKNLSIGYNEQFLVNRNQILFLDGEHLINGVEPLGIDCQLMANRIDVVYDRSGILVKRNVETGDDTSISGSEPMGYWISLEGNLVTVLEIVSQ